MEDQYKIIVVDKKAEKVIIFSVLTDASRYLGVHYKTMQYRLHGDTAWWEDNNIIIAKAIIQKASMRIGNSNFKKI